MTVVPCDLQGVCAMELRVSDAQRIWCTRPWPPLFATIPQRATRRARTSLSQLHQPDPRDVAIGEPDRDALVTFDLEIHRLVAVVHIPRLPDPPAQTTRTGGPVHESWSELTQTRRRRVCGGWRRGTRRGPTRGGSDGALRRLLGEGLDGCEVHVLMDVAAS